MIERDVIKNICWSSCKVPDIIARFSWNFVDRFRKIMKYQISWKSF